MYRIKRINKSKTGRRGFLPYPFDPVHPVQNLGPEYQPCRKARPIVNQESRVDSDSDLGKESG
jgi:hypothetical protein